MNRFIRFYSASTDLDVIFWNKRISDLVRRGLLRDAQQVFDVMHQRTIVSWNAIISGYVRNNDLHQARKLFDEMPQRDIVSWNLMLSGFIREGKMDEAKYFFDRMPTRDAVSWNTLIGGYAANRRMADALDLFDIMPQRNIVTWNTVITGYLNSGDLSSAKELFWRMPVRDSSSWNVLIRGFVQNGELDEAAILLKQMGEAHIDAYNSLLAGYAQCGRVDDAHQLFNEIPTEGCHRSHVQGAGEYIRSFGRNVISWNTMIMCYVKDGNLSAARKLFDEMPVRDIVSWNTLISGYVHALATDEAVVLFHKVPNPDVQTWNCMISGLASNGQLDDAYHFFQRMPHKNLISWNSIISGYEKNEDYIGALDLFSRMNCILAPDKHTLSCVLSVCAALVTLNPGKQIHQCIIKLWIPDTPIQNSLITMYSRCADVEDARKVFEGTHNRDVVSWNAIIGGYAYNGCPDEALLMFGKMKRLKLVPTHVTFLAVLSACGHAGLIGEGQKHFKSMIEEFHISPKMEHFASMVDVLGRNGLLHDAIELIQTMPIVPDESVWGALLSAAKIHSNVEVARISAESLIKLEPENSLPYVVLSNMYANAGRWHCALEIRKVMGENGVKKGPGCSSINLLGKVHVFIAGDLSSPMAGKIYELRSSIIDGRYLRQERLGHCNMVLYITANLYHYLTLQSSSLKLAQVNDGVTWLNIMRTLRIRLPLVMHSDLYPSITTRPSGLFL